MTPIVTIGREPGISGGCLAAGCLGRLAGFPVKRRHARLHRLRGVLAYLYLPAHLEVPREFLDVGVRYVQAHAHREALGQRRQGRHREVGDAVDSHAGRQPGAFAATQQPQVAADVGAGRKDRFAIVLESEVAGDYRLWRQRAAQNQGSGLPGCKVMPLPAVGVVLPLTRSGPRRNSRA